MNYLMDPIVGELPIDVVPPVGRMSGMSTRGRMSILRQMCQPRKVDSEGFVANSTLRHEDWLMYDERLIHVARNNLMAVMDLKDMGLVKMYPNWGVMESHYERASDLTDAQVDMNPGVAADYDRITFDEVTVPLPVFHKDWILGQRQLDASELHGHSLSTDMMEIVSKVVMERIEKSLFNGIKDKRDENWDHGGHKIYGYLNHPSRNQVVITNWSTSNASIISDVQKMEQSLIDANYANGFYYLYIARNLKSSFGLDYKTYEGRTVAERIMANDSIRAIKYSPYIPDNQAVLVNMMSEVVDLAIAEDVKNVEYMTDAFTSSFKVFACLAPRVKSTKTGQSGIAHGAISF